MKRLSTVALAFTLLVAGSAHATPSRTWYLTNSLWCTQDGSNITCNANLTMYEGGGNTVAPTGFTLIQDGATRVWISDDAEPVTEDLSGHTWTLTLGGASAVTGVRWVVGSYDVQTGAFAPANGAETFTASAGASTFSSPSFIVPAGTFLALRITGTSGAPSLIDVWDRAGTNGGNSPSTLRLE